MTLEIADINVPPGERNWLPTGSLDHALASDLATLVGYRCRLVSCAFWHHLPPWQPPQRELIDEGIYVTLRGGMAITTTDGKRHAVGLNRVALVPRWRRHQHGFLFDDQQSHQLLSIHCHWTNPAGQSLFNRLPEIVVDMPSPTWRQRLLSLAYLWAENPTTAIALAPSLLGGLLHDLLCSGTRLLPANDSDEAISAALARCQRDDWPRLSVKDLADAAKLKPSRFRERFQASLGMSPVRYLQGLRLEQAARQLDTSDAELGSIAHSVGYSSVTHFHAAFKQRFGCTPQAWRMKELG